MSAARLSRSGARLLDTLGPPQLIVVLTLLATSGGCAVCGKGYDGDPLMESVSPNGAVRVTIRLYSSCVGDSRVGVFVETSEPVPSVAKWVGSKEVYRGPSADDFTLAFLAVAWLEDSSSFAVAFSNGLGGEQSFVYFRWDGARIPYPKDSWQYLKAIQATIAKEYGPDIPEASQSWHRRVSDAGKEAFFSKYMRPHIESLRRKQ